MWPGVFLCIFQIIFILKLITIVWKDKGNGNKFNIEFRNSCCFY